MMKFVVCAAIALCASGCMKNECGDGNDQDRGAVTVGLSRAVLNDKARDDASDLTRQWWWCEVKGIATPPAGSDWMRITIDAPRNVLNGVGGWLRIDEAEQLRLRRVESDEDERWHLAARMRAQRLTNGAPVDVTCLNAKDSLENLDRFISCKEPVEHGPATPGGGTDTTPLPPGSTGGDP